MRLTRLFGFGAAGGESMAFGGSFVEGNTAFAFKLYDLLNGGEGNLFFSPFSISTCLAMAYAGARGNTETQMSQVLHFSKNQSHLHSDFGGLHRQLLEAAKPKVIQIQRRSWPSHPARTEEYVQPPGIQLDIINGLWAQEGHPFVPAFLKIATEDYQASVKQADFKTEAAAVTEEINRWVAEKTCDKIQNMLPPGSVNLLTRLVLANAIYFKGAWASPFKERFTSLQPFLLSTFRQTEVQLMERTDDFKYCENKDLQAVELPYRGVDLSMVILLPRRTNGCRQLEQQLSPTMLSATLGQMIKQKVQLYLPRFKVESGFELGATLAKMGMPDAFSPNADFSGLDGTRDLFISDVFHKAWGKINEEGTEATAATAAPVALGIDESPPTPPPVFRADHPFLFLIRDVRSGTLLFIGRLTDPSA